MNDGLDTALVLPTVGEKPSKPYRTSPYTVREYAALPYAQRRAVDAACDEAAGLIRTDYADDTSPQPYTVGRATKRASRAQLAQLNPSVETSPPPAKGAPEAPFTQLDMNVETLTPSPSTLQLPLTMPLSTVHPAPSPALHTLNTPERIHHDTTHPDNLATFAVAATAPRNAADLLDVVSRYTTLTEDPDTQTEWTHWGTSPLLSGDTHSFAVNIGQNIFKCFTSGKTGDVVDFVMFMEEVDEAGALVWLAVHFPDYYAPEPEPTPTPEVVGPACAYPGLMFGPLAEALNEAATRPAAAAPAAPVALPGVTYQTTDYSLFHLLPENRAVNRQQVRKLVAQISRKNLLHIKPLDVTADLGIIDGQHRLEAARELGVPVYYRIGEQLGEEDIAILNATSKNWTGTDYLHHWSVKGSPAYQTLAAFMQRHPALSFSNAKMMLSGLGEGGGKADIFRDGKWQVGPEEKAEATALLIERVASEVPSFKQAAHTGFVAMVYHCVARVEGFDPKEFMRKILANPRALVPCSGHKQWLTMFGEIYNYRTNADNRVRFD
ncbi:MAG: CHC2 zinc finger domain-containing protein [Janthinobacterium lividum]